jgi:hypothetical protein
MNERIELDGKKRRRRGEEGREENKKRNRGREEYSIRYIIVYV